MRIFVDAFLVLFLICSAIASPDCFETLNQTYKLDWSATGSSFFDGFDFVTVDKNNGAAQYLPREEALLSGVAESHGTHAIMRVGSKGDMLKRKSAYIASKKDWMYFLVTMKFSHVPWGCGVWPAFWSNDPDLPWPDGGEVDIFEYANDFLNKVSLHTGSVNRCKLDASLFHKPGCSAMPDTNGPDYNCFTSYPGHLGCAPNNAQGMKPGAAFASSPGVIAMEKTSSYIKVFLIPDAEIPADLTNGAPLPDKWDQWVISYFPFAASERAVPGSCPLAGQTVKSQQLILNIGLCGDWAGSTWALAGSCVNKVGPKYPSQCQSEGYSSAIDCCTQFMWDDQYGSEEYLAEKAYFNISWINVYTPLSPQPGPTPPTPPTPTPPPTPPPTPSSAACSAHPSCSHLAGNCCPNDSGLMLECCGSRAIDVFVL